MRITFVVPDGGLSGGIRVIAIYAEHLQERGHQVCIVATPPKSPTLKRRLKALLKGQGWLPDPLRGPSHLDNIKAQLHVVDRFRPITDKDVPDADVVVATWWETSLWVAKLSPVKGAKAYFMQDYGAAGQELEKIVPTWSLPLHMITISQWLVELIRQYCKQARIALVPNSIDTNIFHAASRGKQPFPTIGFLYSSKPTKGADLALEAIALARRQVPDLRVIMFGSEALSPMLSLPPNTMHEHMPSDDRIREIYASCDAWLFPSRLEGFGLPILEAMACRTPVIGTPAGAAPELLEGGAGILVRPNDSEDMARAIVKICQFSEAEWLRMSSAAHAKASSYTWGEATDLFEAALCQAIEYEKSTAS